MNTLTPTSDPPLLPDAGRRLSLPAWLNIPILIALPFALFAFFYMVYKTPLSLLGFLPLLSVGTFLLWITRTRALPKSYQIQAFLWGATVSVTISFAVNTFVASQTEGLWIAAVISAPIIEEITKGLVVLWIVYAYKKIENPLDGIVIAAWSALGFAVLENMLYIMQTDQGVTPLETTTETSPLTVAIVRGVFTPFLHSMFTIWIGYAIGKAIYINKKLSTALWALPVAIALHAAWNGVPIWITGEELYSPDQITDEQAITFLIWILGFFSLFVGTITVLANMRNKEKDRFIQLILWLGKRYNISPKDLPFFTQWHTILTTQRATTGSNLQRFLQMKNLLLRLAILNDRIYFHKTLSPHTQTEEELTQDLEKHTYIQPPPSLPQLPNERLT